MPSDKEWGRGSSSLAGRCALLDSAMPGLPSLGTDLEIVANRLPAHADAGASEVSAFRDAAGGLLVLSRDAELLQVIGHVSAGRAVIVVNAETELANRLLSDPVGVVVLDAAAAATAIGALTERLRTQFPDHIWLVAGDHQHQTTLTADITKGSVYRFLHKPVSEQRIRLMLDAAWRRHEEQLAGGAEAPLPTSMTVDHRGPLSRPAVVGVAAVVAVAVGVWVVEHGSATSGPHAMPPVLSGATPSADEAQLADLLSRSEKALTDERLDEAQKLVGRAQTLKPDDVRVAFLSARIGKEHERALLTMARRASSSGNIQQAIAVLGSARSGTPAQAADAPQKGQDKDARILVGDYLIRADERIRTGALIEPAENNAQFFTESAAALAPDDPDVKQAQERLVDVLRTETHKALSGRNEALGERLIAAAAESGMSKDEIAALTAEARHAQSAQTLSAAPSPVAVEKPNSAEDSPIARTNPPAPAPQNPALQLIRYVPPEFPAQANDQGISGWVDVGFVVKPDGSVGDAAVLEAQPAGVFDRAALNAVGKWRYSPPQRDGQPVEQHGRVRLRFALQH